MENNNAPVTEIWRTVFRYFPAALLILRTLLFLYLESFFIELGRTNRAQEMRKKSARLSEDYIQKTAPRKYILEKCKNHS